MKTLQISIKFPNIREVFIIIIILMILALLRVSKSISRIRKNILNAEIITFNKVLAYF